MEIKIVTDEQILDQCAHLMHESEPFITLKFDLEKCMASMRGDFKDIVVAYINNEFAGFVVLQLSGVLRGYIQTLCVVPAFRNQGIGTALMNFSEERLKKQFANVFICVSSFNHKAQALYYRLGFEKVGEFKDHIMRGHDEYLLRKSQCPIIEFLPSIIE